MTDVYGNTPMHHWVLREVVQPLYGWGFGDRWMLEERGVEDAPCKRAGESVEDVMRERRLVCVQPVSLVLSSFARRVAGHYGRRARVRYCRAFGAVSHVSW